MASIFDIFGGGGSLGSSLGGALGGMLGGGGGSLGGALGGMLGGAGSSLGNSLGGLLGGSVGDVLNTLSTKARSAQNDFDSNITRKGGLGGLLGAGALGALLGNVAGGSLLKNAALLGAGAVALNFYKKWAEGKQGAAQPAAPRGAQAPQIPASQAAHSGEAALPQFDNPTMELITRAMVYAAKSDGNIDANERECMTSILASMLPDANVTAMIKKIENEQVDPGKIVQAVRSSEQGEDIYRLSCSVITVDQFMERAYMDALARALGISAAEQKSIEKEAQDVHKQLVASLEQAQ